MQAIAAVIMMQILFFKFSGARESVCIFSTGGLEPEGRCLAGGSELIDGVLLLLPKWRSLGAPLVGIGMMLGAMVWHLSFRGIEVMGDGEYLFILAVVVLLCSLGVVILNRQQMETI